MKILLLLTTMIMSSTILAQTEYKSFRYWKNDTKKTINYFRMPNYKLDLEVIDASEEYYGMVTIEQKPHEDKLEELEELYPGYKLQHVDVERVDEGVNVRFIGETYEAPLFFNISQTPSGPLLTGTHFATKEGFSNFTNAIKVEFDYRVKAKFLNTEVVEAKKLAKGYCERFKTPNQDLIKTLQEYERAYDEIMRDEYFYSETRDKLLVKLQETCFKDLNKKVNTFVDLLNTKLKIKNNARDIHVKTLRDRMSSKTVYLEGRLK